MKLPSFRNKSSIRSKAAFAQIILIIIPVFLCTALLYMQVSSDTADSNARVTYQYDRYVIDTLDTSARQMESLANTLAGNKSIRTYVAMEPGDERDTLYQQSVSGLLKYGYNRYIPTHNIEILPGKTLQDITPGESTVYYQRSEYRMWVFSRNDSLTECSFYYQFEGERNTPALIVFTPSSSMLTDLISSISSINGQHCALGGSDGTPLLIPDSLSGEEQELLRSNSPDITEGYQLLSRHRVLYRIRCEALPLIFVSVQSVSGTPVLTSSLIPIALLSIALIAVCIFISRQVFFKGITRRIIRLSDACESLTFEQSGAPASGIMQADAEGAISLPSVEVMGNDEIGALSVSINHMIRRIGELSNLNAREVRESQRTAYDMLAAQIHPHFIYNTLENLRMMAEINDDQEVADQLYALGRMLRLSISDASSMGEVSMEIEHARMYLQLQKMRLNNQLEYTIEPAGDEILHVKCPRFLLQPLVENALKHGFQQKNRPGRIVISTGTYERGIWLRVFNDGTGLTPERLEEVREGLRQNQPILHTRGGIGLVNVNSRLKLFFGPDAGITIESTPGEGTTCTLWLTTNG